MIPQAEDNVGKGKLRVAVEDYKAALAIDPNHIAYNVHLHLGLCKVLVTLGRGKDAISSCTEALSIDEELIDALVQVTSNHTGVCPDVAKLSQDLCVMGAIIEFGVKMSIFSLLCDILGYIFELISVCCLCCGYYGFWCSLLFFLCIDTQCYISRHLKAYTLRIPLNFVFIIYDFVFISLIQDVCLYSCVYA